MAKLSKPILISYGALAVPLAALGLPLTVYLPPFYEGPIGLSVGTVGVIFMLARFWDIFTDPFMGALVDKYPSKWGRRKHWIVIGIPILMLASWYVFIPSEGEKTPIYLIFWLFILYLAYTFVGLTQQAWGVDLTSKYNERSQVYGWREIGSIFGMMAVLAFPAILEIFGYDFRTMVAGMGYFLLVAFPLTALISLIIIPDNKISGGTNFPKLFDIKKILKNNNPLKRVLVAEMLCSTASSISGSTFIYLAIHVFEMGDISSRILFIYFFAGLLAMPIWMFLSYKIGKHKVLFISALLCSLILSIYIPLYYLVNISEAFWLIIILTTLFGIGYGAPFTLTRAMMADISDADELRSGEKRPALFFSVLTTLSKFGSAVAVGMVYLYLESVGFSSGNEVSNSIKESIVFAFAFFPMIFYFLASLVCIGYELTPEKHKEIQLKLEKII